MSRKIRMQLYLSEEEVKGLERHFEKIREKHLPGCYLKHDRDKSLYHKGHNEAMRIISCAKEVVLKF